MHAELLPLEPTLQSYAQCTFGSEHRVGQLVITNLVRRPWLPRYNTRDLASAVTVDMATGAVLPGAFRLHGRHPSTRSISLGRTTLYYDLIVGSVLQPLGLAECMCQVVLSSEETATRVTLLVLRVAAADGGSQQRSEESMDAAESRSLDNKFREYIASLAEGDNIHGKAEFVSSQHRFAKSDASAKLVKFVDCRAK